MSHPQLIIKYMPARRKKVGNINLIIKSDEGINLTDQLISWALNYGRYILIITQIVVLSVFFLRFKLDRDNTDLKEATSQKQAIIESISDLETEIRTVQDRLSNIKKVTNNQNYSLSMLEFLEENIPSDVIFTNMNFTSDKLVFSASSRSLLSFNYLLKTFQQDKKFTEVILEDIQRRADGKIEFKITAKIDKRTVPVL